MNAIITFANGFEFCRNPYFQVFLKSLKTSHFQGDVIIFTQDMDESIRKIITAYGYQVVDVDVSNVRYLLIDRFQIYHEFLCDKKYDGVLLADSKDVYFQDDPFEYLKKDRHVLLCGEGGKHTNNEWNVLDQLKCQDELCSQYHRDTAERPILNAGFIMGTTHEVADLCLMIWLNTLRTKNKFTDQASFNYLYHFLEKDPAYEVLTPQDTAFCATGQGINQGWFQADWRDGMLYHKTLGAPYAAFHQWDRTQYKRDILQAVGLHVPKEEKPVMPEMRPAAFEKPIILFK